MPCLLFGGMVADRIGARPVVLTGGVVAALGNLSLLLWHGAAGLMVGRFIVGLGVGLSSGEEPALVFRVDPCSSCGARE